MSIGYMKASRFSLNIGSLMFASGCVVAAAWKFCSAALWSSLPLLGEEPESLSAIDRCHLHERHNLEVPANSAFHFNLSTQITSKLQDFR